MCKKIITVLVCFVLCIVTGGCGNTLGQCAAPTVFDFSAEAYVEALNGAQQFKAAFSRLSTNGSSVSSITVTSPKSIQGITYRCQAGEYYIEYGKKSCKSANAYFSPQSFVNVIFTVLDAAENTAKSVEENPCTAEADTVVYKGESSCGKYIMTVCKASGIIKSISLCDNTVSVTFDNVKKINEG